MFRLSVRNSTNRIPSESNVSEIVAHIVHEPSVDRASTQMQEVTQPLDCAKQQEEMKHDQTYLLSVEDSPPPEAEQLPKGTLTPSSMQTPKPKRYAL